MGEMLDRAGRIIRGKFSPLTAAFAFRPNAAQRKDADDLIDGLHKARVVGDVGRDDLKEAVKATGVTDPFIDVNELSNYSSKRIRNLRDVLRSSPGYRDIPDESVGAVEDALRMAERIEAQEMGSLFTRRQVVLLGLLAAGCGGTSYWLAKDLRLGPIAPVPAVPRSLPPSVVTAPASPKPSPSPSAPPVVVVKTLDVFGPEAAEKAFGIKMHPSIVPPIPFKEPELNRAAVLDQFLILRPDKGPDGKALTMEVMEQLYLGKIRQGGVMNGNGWHQQEGFFTKDAPRLKWSLVSTDLVPGTQNKNFFQQTQVLGDYLRGVVFEGGEPSRVYMDALSEFDSRRTQIARILSSDPERAAHELAALQLNKLTRHNPVELLYDMLVVSQNKGKDFMFNKTTWTRTPARRGLISMTGLNDHGGAGGVAPYPYPPRDSTKMGVILSRSLIM